MHVLIRSSYVAKLILGIAGEKSRSIQAYGSLYAEHSPGMVKSGLNYYVKLPATWRIAVTVTWKYFWN